MPLAERQALHAQYEQDRADYYTDRAKRIEAAKAARRAKQGALAADYSARFRGQRVLEARLRELEGKIDRAITLAEELNKLRSLEGKLAEAIALAEELSRAIRGSSAE